MATPGQMEQNLNEQGLAVTTTRRNGVTRHRFRQVTVGAAADSRPCNFSKYRTVGQAWAEWNVGIGGNKPVRLWTEADRQGPHKSTYSRRAPLFNLLSTLVRAGREPPLAIQLVDEAYKHVKGIGKIAAAIRNDMQKGTLPQEVRV